MNKTLQLSSNELVDTRLWTNQAAAILEMAEEQIENGITAAGRNESGTLLPQNEKNGVNKG